MAHDLSDFARDGYLHLPGVFSPAEVAHLRAAMARLQDRAAGLTASTDRFRLGIFGQETPVVQQIAEPHEAGGDWMALARDPRLLDLAEAILGPDLLLYYSMAMMKPARSGAPVPWHQDLAFFPHDRAAVIAAQVYLDDATVENGCIRLVPGSHRRGMLNHYDGDRFAGQVIGDTAALDAAEVAVPVAAGGVLVWHALTLHRSEGNATGRPRRTVVFEYKSPAATLLRGSFSPGEVRPAGLMVRGRDPAGQLLSAL